MQTIQFLLFTIDSTQKIPYLNHISIINARQSIKASSQNDFIVPEVLFLSSSYKVSYHQISETMLQT